MNACVCLASILLAPRAHAIVKVLTSLVLAYVSPVTSDNQELRQCLAYFLPVYCYSLPANQDRMRAVCLVLLPLILNIHRDAFTGFPHSI